MPVGHLYVFFGRPKTSFYVNFSSWGFLNWLCWQHEFKIKYNWDIVLSIGYSFIRKLLFSSYGEIDKPLYCLSLLMGRVLLAYLFTSMVLSFIQGINASFHFTGAEDFDFCPFKSLKNWPYTLKKRAPVLLHGGQGPTAPWSYCSAFQISIHFWLQKIYVVSLRVIQLSWHFWMSVVGRFSCYLVYHVAGTLCWIPGVYLVHKDSVSHHFKHSLTIFSTFLPSFLSWQSSNAYILPLDLAFFLTYTAGQPCRKNLEWSKLLPVRIPSPVLCWNLHVAQQA